MKLVIAGKPSVANNIAKVLGARKRQDGFIEGNGYIISWCVGHLIQMSNPDKYDRKYKRWTVESLPIFPDHFKYEIANYTKKQFNVLKKLLNEKRVDCVINACDDGGEGERIFRLVYNMAKSKKPIKRLWISSLEDAAIKKGFANLKDGEEYINVYHFAVARAQADWLIGMNLSRYYSCENNKNYSVGRVQTPTLSMIVDRDREIKEFKKEKYYTVTLECDGISFTSEKINIKAEAESLIKNLSSEFFITEVEKRRRL